MLCVRLKSEVAFQTCAWAVLCGGSIVGALETDGWASVVFWLVGLSIGGIVVYGLSLLYRSRGMDVDH
jgi:hypothetical protein